MENHKLSSMLGALALATLVIGSVAFIASDNQAGTASLFDALNMGSRNADTAIEDAQGPVISVRVIAVDGNNITVEGIVQKKFTVDASGAKITKIFGKSEKDISTLDIKEGDTISINGNMNVTVLADSIVSRGGPLDHFSVVGSIETVNDNALTVKNIQGTSYVVSLFDYTGISKDGQEVNKTALLVGDNIIATGVFIESSNTIEANNIVVNNNFPKPPVLP